MGKDIFDLMKESKNPLLQAEAEDVKAQQGLKHNKEDLQLLLNGNIVKIDFMTSDKNRVVRTFTSNMIFVKLLSEEKKKNRKVLAEKLYDSKGIITKDPFSVDSWDIEENKRKTISLKSWQIIECIRILPERALLLAEIYKNALK